MKHRNEAGQLLASKENKGAATSANKMNRPVGYVAEFGFAWFENGRLVKWKEVADSVARGYERARWRAASRGARWLDGMERVRINIAQAMVNRGHHA